MPCLDPQLIGIVKVFVQRNFNLGEIVRCVGRYRSHVLAVGLATIARRSSAANGPFVGFQCLAGRSPGRRRHEGILNRPWTFFTKRVRAPSGSRSPGRTSRHRPTFKSVLRRCPLRLVASGFAVPRPCVATSGPMTNGRACPVVVRLLTTDRPSNIDYERCLPHGAFAHIGVESRRHRHVGTW